MVIKNIKERVKHSLGQKAVNNGTERNFIEEKCIIDYSRKFFLFDVIPVGAVRLTHRDRIFTNPNHPDPKKRQRKAVTQYWAFKNSLLAQATELKFELGNWIDAVFVIPMPQSWSEKKKKQMNGMPCLQKPDADNLVKSVLDALKKNDSDVWWMSAKKYWGFKGSIIIYK